MRPSIYFHGLVLVPKKKYFLKLLKKYKVPIGILSNVPLDEVFGIIVRVTPRFFVLKTSKPVYIIIHYDARYAIFIEDFEMIPKLMNKYFKKKSKKAIYTTPCNDLSTHNYAEYLSHIDTCEKIEDPVVIEE